MLTAETLPETIRQVVKESFPDASKREVVSLEDIVWNMIEGKDVGSFKGAISGFKQTAIDTAAAMPRPVSSRRALEKDARKQLDKVVNRAENDMLHWYGRVKGDESRKITPTRFKREMKKTLRIAYTDAYHLGTRASGLARASDLAAHTSVDEKRWIDKVFSQEQKFFNKLLDTLIRRESKSAAATRIRNYANAVRSVFDSARMLQLPDESILHWVLQSGNPCPECRLLHRLSPYTKETLPTTPKAGSTRCLAYCYCKIRVVKASAIAVRKVAAKNKSAKDILGKLRKSRKKKR